MTLLPNPRLVAAALVAVAAVAAPARSVAQAPEEERALDAVTIPADRSPSPKLPEWAARDARPADTPQRRRRGLPR